LEIQHEGITAVSLRDVVVVEERTRPVFDFHWLKLVLWWFDDVGWVMGTACSPCATYFKSSVLLKAVAASVADLTTVTLLFADKHW